MAEKSWLKQPIAKLQQALREQAVSARDLHLASKAAIESDEAARSAYRQVQRIETSKACEAVDQALAVGEDYGPLMGLPISIKDIYGVPGYETWAGSPRKLPPAWEIAGPVVHNALTQKAIVTGKTHTVEFAFGGLGVNQHHGTPINPHDRSVHRVPGGSSSGAGVSVATGTAVLAFGTDTAGSVRVPASMTGLTGLKTTRGRWSTQGIVPLSSSLDSPGLLGHRVEDVAIGYAAIETASRSDDLLEAIRKTAESEAFRLGIPSRFFRDDCSPGINEAFEKAVGQFEQEGIGTVSAELPGTAQAWELFRQGGLAGPELFAFLSAELPDWLNTLDERVAMRIRGAEQMRAAEYIYRQKTIDSLSAEAEVLFDHIDALITPTVAITPPRLVDIAGEREYAESNYLALRNTVMVNLMGLCALTIPIGKDAEGMPVGLQVIGRSGADTRIIAIGLQLEQALSS